jgi:hypothetical protein
VAEGSLTHERLTRVAAAFDDQAQRVRELMAPLGLANRSEAHAVHVGLGTELPLQQGLSSYYTNLHRDWFWGDEENRAGLAATKSFHNRRLIAMLGAGAGRLRSSPRTGRH